MRGVGIVFFLVGLLITAISTHPAALEQEFFRRIVEVHGGYYAVGFGVLLYVIGLAGDLARHGFQGGQTRKQRAEAVESLKAFRLAENEKRIWLGERLVGRIDNDRQFEAAVLVTSKRLIALRLSGPSLPIDLDIAQMKISSEGNILTVIHQGTRYGFSGRQASPLQSQLAALRVSASQT